MKRVRKPELATAIGAALLMHVLLLAATRSSTDDGVISTPFPPRTLYAFPYTEGEVDMVSVRVIKSPTVFSLPSGLGFSRELHLNDVQNTKTITPLQVRSEHFHKIAPDAYGNGESLHPENLMISATVRGPDLPSEPPQQRPLQRTAKRIQLAPELVGRLLGGVVLPPDLNQPVDQPWVVHASVSVSEQGAVEHVFLNEPLESATLNHQVLQVLYKLRFKPGNAVDSSIEIYSPEAAAVREEAE